MNYQYDEEEDYYGEEEESKEKEEEGQHQNEEGDDNDSQSEQPPVQKPMIVLCKSSVNLGRSHDMNTKSEDCSYCHGKRETIQGLEENVPYYKCGFSSTKFRADDYEAVLN